MKKPLGFVFPVSCFVFETDFCRARHRPATHCCHVHDFGLAFAWVCAAHLRPVMWATVTALDAANHALH